MSAFWAQMKRTLNARHDSPQLLSQLPPRAKSLDFVINAYVVSFSRPPRCCNIFVFCRAIMTERNIRCQILIECQRECAQAVIIVATYKIRSNHRVTFDGGCSLISVRVVQGKQDQNQNGCKILPLVGTFLTRMLNGNIFLLHPVLDSKKATLQCMSSAYLQDAEASLRKVAPRRMPPCHHAV